MASRYSQSHDADRSLELAGTNMLAFAKTFKLLLHDLQEGISLWHNFATGLITIMWQPWSWHEQEYMIPFLHRPDTEV